MLDAHTNVWGLGEDSIFNTNIPIYRDEIVEYSSRQNTKELTKVTIKHANAIVDKMKQLATDHFSKIEHVEGIKNLKHIKKITDKMLFNYRNIGKCNFCSYFVSKAKNLLLQKYPNKKSYWHYQNWYSNLTFFFSFLIY